VQSARSWHLFVVRLALIACRPTPTNDALANVPTVDGRWERMTPHQAVEVLRAGDAALGRLDVLPTLDGIDDGLWALGALAARGVVVLNEPASLLAAHDKLLTARLLRRHGVPHPPTWHVREGRPIPRPGPAVLKPRFGSWGLEVHRCDDASSLEAAIERVRCTGWFRRHGAIVQALVPPQGYDLRILVAVGRAVGAAYRIAAPGEWRTNVALGGARRSVAEPPPDAATVAVEAARATGAMLVGVDLLPDGRGGWVVAELNGAVEFTADYATWHDVFAETACAILREVREKHDWAADISPLAVPGT
jgi:RimK family alpha-L-glutamate ligase